MHTGADPFVIRCGDGGPIGPTRSYAGLIVDGKMPSTPALYEKTWILEAPFPELVSAWQGGAMSAARPTGLVGVGYEGRDIDQVVSELCALQVSRLVDVRLTPLSRKPGFSKTSLGRVLADVGIDYEHRPELGNPKGNRAGFAGAAGELSEARAVFASLLRRSPAADAIDALVAAAACERLALLCFEAEEQRCHRAVVLAEVDRRCAIAVDSRRRAR